MKSRLLVLVALGLVASALLLDVSRAHGGAYRAPPRRGPKDAPTIHVPGRPSLPTGPTTGAPAAGPTAGPVTGSRPTSGGGPTGPRTGGGALPASVVPGTGGAFSPSADGSSWAVWWGFNKDAFLDLKSHVFRTPVVSGTDEFFLGLGASGLATDNLRPTKRQTSEIVVPTLLRALERSDEDDVITSCLIALARIGADAALLEATATKYLGHANGEVSETAILALGIAGNPSSVGLLRDLLLDTKAGRRAIDKSSVDVWRRSFAAYALGLVGMRTPNEDVRSFVVGTLARGLDVGDDASPDVDAACVISMGLVPLQRVEHPHAVGERQTFAASISRTAQVERLLALLDERDADRLVRAHVPGALARLCTAPARVASSAPDDTTGHPALEALTERVVRDLLVRTRNRTTEPREVVGSCVIALGQLGDCDEGGTDAEIRARLADIPAASSDAQVRRFALIALGEVGGRRGSGEPTVGRLEAVRVLSSTLVRGDSGLQRWAGLALGLLGHDASLGGDVPPREVGAAVRSSLRESKSPSDVGAFAIAAGILGDLDSIPVLREKLSRVSEDETVGYVAVALGLLGDRASIESIRRIASESEYRPVRLRETAVALGLLGDKEAVPQLAEMLLGARSLAAQASLASALGRIGDRRAIDSLVSMLEDRGNTATSRGFAAAALGIVADDELLPWNAHLAVRVNYRAAPATLFDELGTRGLLTLL
jgi:HEAT repeat protein